MTSLDRARAHLLFCQELLREMRRLCPSGLGLEEYEDYFLSALSRAGEEETRASLGDDPYDIGYAKGFHDAEYVYSECQ